MHWRNLELLKQAVINDQCEQVSLHFDHGVDCNQKFVSKDKKKAGTESVKSLKIPVPDA